MTDLTHRLRLLIVFAVLMLIGVLTGCELDQAKQIARDALVGAEGANTEIDQLQEQLDQLDLSTPGGDERAAQIVALIEKTKDERAGFMQAFDEAVAEIEKADDAIDIGVAIGSGMAGLIPGLSVLVPVLRSANRWRRHFTNVVTAVGDGGGPSDPDKTRASMPLETRAAVRSALAGMGKTGVLPQGGPVAGPK